MTQDVSTVAASRTLKRHERRAPFAEGTSCVRFDIATIADDADLRRLLRESPMPGQISISLEREPDYFADASVPGNERQTIIARERGRVVCMGSCAIRERFVNGERHRVGYLGGLRLDAGVAGRFNVVRGGYEFFRELQGNAPADFYFTTIAAENQRARNFLERGLPGMPRYEFVGEFVTLLVPISRGSRRKQAHPKIRNPKSEIRPDPSLLTPAAKDELMAILHQQNIQYQFAPCWSVDELTALCPLGLRREDFRLVRDGRRIVACAALWDQRCFKQTVIRGYAPWLRLVRPALNIITRLTGGLRLPPVGETLANACVSHLVVAHDKPQTLLALFVELRATAAGRNLECLTLGFAANDPRLIAFRRNLGCREYRSRIYVVRWPDLGASAAELDGRVLAPEVALL